MIDGKLNDVNVTWISEIERGHWKLYKGSWILVKSRYASEPALACVQVIFELDGVLWAQLRLHFGVLCRAAGSPLMKALMEDLRPENGEECIVNVASLELTILDSHPTYFDPAGATLQREPATMTFYYR